MPRTKLLELRISSALLQDVRTDLFTADGNENFGVLFCTLHVGDANDILLSREWLPAPPEAYITRLPYHLEIAPDFLNQVVDEALRRHLTPVIAHSHPASYTAKYSASDDFGESRLLPVLTSLLPGMRPASLLVATHDFVGRTYSDGRFHYLTEVRAGGRPFCPAVLPPASRNTMPAPASLIHERQVRAFGQASQRILESLRIGIVGAGGTGSAVAEQVARLGVKDIVVVDPDRVEESNLSRLWGALPVDASESRHKAKVVTAHIARIAPRLHTKGLVADITRESVVTQLADCHIVFGCTDNHWSRAVLNRFAHQYLLPVIDMGVRIDARSGTISAIGGQVSLLGVGFACLRCSGLISPDRVRAESMNGLERKRLDKEGYIQGIGEIAPSVISLNTVVAGLAVTMALGLVTSNGSVDGPLLLRYDGLKGEVFSVSAKHRPGCDVCDPGEGVVALGGGQAVTAYD